MDSGGSGAVRWLDQNNLFLVIARDGSFIPKCVEKATLNLLFHWPVTFE